MKREITLLILFLTMAGVQEATAVPGYLDSFNMTYSSAIGTRIDVCLLCHTNPFGGARNPYGTHYNENGHNFTTIEPMDSDGDGFTNIQEIRNMTFPGDIIDFPPAITGSTPTSSVVNTIVGGPTVNFIVTVNQIINVSWLINGNQIQDSITTGQNNQSTYSNSSANEGIWNITAIARKGVASASNTWTWNVGPSVAVQTFNLSGSKINNDTGIGIPGWTITLTNGTMTVTNTTDDTGMYLFTGLENGTYMVTETMQSGWTNVTPASIEVIVDGADVTGRNFTNTPPAVPPLQTFGISGFKINNDTGIGIPGWTITLTNGTMTVTNTTDDTGMYLFTGLENGTYTVTETMQSGWTNVTPASIEAIVDGADVTGLNFTNTPPAVPPLQTFGISGFKINNDTGIGIPGWTITLTNGTMTVTNTTDDTGMYLFAGLENGTYTVTETMQSGWTNVTPASIEVIVDGADLTGRNFTNGMLPPQPIVTGIELIPGKTAALNGSTLTMTVKALNGSVTETNFNGMANITVTASRNTNLVIYPPNVTFDNGIAILQVTSNIVQFVTVTATEGSVTATVDVAFADRVFDLDMGWNLISIPSFADPEAIDQALKNVKNNGVVGYDPASRTFSTPSGLKPLYGYWINVTAHNQSIGFMANMNLTGVPPGRDIYEGWNLIGVSADRNDDPAISINGSDLFHEELVLAGERLYTRLIDRSNMVTYTGAEIDGALLNQGKGYWLFVKSIPNKNVNNVPWSGKSW